MAKSSATEVFRFVCARPAQKDVRSIRIPSQYISDETIPHDNDPRTISRSRSISFATTSRSLKYTDKILALDEQLHLEPKKIRTGLSTELDPKLVRSSIKAVFGNEDLAKLVENEDWAHDEEILGRKLAQLWLAASDSRNLGPRITHQRQLYDLVRQAADPSTGKEGQDPFVLRGLELDTTTEFLRGVASTRTQGRQESITRKVLAADDDANKTKLTNLVKALLVLNSADIQQYRHMDELEALKFRITSNWIDLLSDPAAKQTVIDAGVVQAVPPNPPLENDLSTYYNMILSAIRGTAASINSSPTFKSGIFMIGPFNLEMVKPWTLDIAGTTTQPTDTPTPEPPVGKIQPSKIKPTGVGDLLVVRDHIYKYIGGDIGAIQNVLASEGLVHETRRLDRTKEVIVSSTETQTEDDREQTTATRFALNKEANDIIKKDSSLKAGVSTTAYGPYVTVKGDLSYAENNAKESSNKVASQYSQDITSRASSKIIEKTFNSTTRTTISQFAENNRHEFKNTAPGSKNISGVYQWVNKVSQCQMYNYGKRLLIDIIVPEPAAFLMSQSGDAGPSLANPTPLTESASDLHEGNYSAIAARYQATGIKPPSDLLMSFSESFKADVNAAVDPKPGGANAHYWGGVGSVNANIEIPTGYLAYAARIQVGVRTRHRLNWTDQDTTGDNIVWPVDLADIPKTNPYISVAGHIIRANTMKESDTLPIPPDTVDTTATTPDDLIQNSVGIVFFNEPLLSTHIAVAISDDMCLALSGTIQVCCIRDPYSYIEWQQTTYEAIATAYASKEMEYQRARAETAISTMNVTTGNNPLENTAIISTELKKTAISFMTSQNYNKFGTVKANTEDKIPEVADTDLETAIAQGRYADFLEKAFEWENMTYTLFPYFWGSRKTWRDRVGFQSPDPTFSAFVKAGMAKVTVPARLGFGLEVIHMLENGHLWQEGPVSTLASSPFYSAAQEIMAAEANPAEVKVSEPWYTVIPTDLVQLRAGPELPEFEPDKNGVWVEKKRKPGQAGDDNGDNNEEEDDDDED